jgi:hypothetical protein
MMRKLAARDPAQSRGLKRKKIPFLLIPSTRASAEEAGEVAAVDWPQLAPGTQKKRWTSLGIDSVRLGLC